MPLTNVRRASFLFLRQHVRKVAQCPLGTSTGPVGAMAVKAASILLKHSEATDADFFCQVVVHLHRTDVEASAPVWAEEGLQ